MTVKELSQTASLTLAAQELAREDSTASSYVDVLEQKELYEDAIRFTAYSREPLPAIRWASTCIHQLRDPQQANDACLDAADRWLETPGEPARQAAGAAADKPEAAGAGRLAALAVFLSGGSIASPGSPMAVEPPAYTAQQLVAGAVTIAVVSHEPEHAVERYKKALELARRP